MLGIQLGGMPRWAADLMCRFFIAVGKGRERVFTMEEFKAEEPFSASGAASVARYTFYREMQKKEEAYQTCCSTYSWVYGAICAGKRALKKERAACVRIPVLVVQAEEDAFVTPKEQEQFVEKIADGRLLLVPSRHETFRAGNDVMEPYFAEVFEFLARV